MITQPLTQKITLAQYVYKIVFWCWYFVEDQRLEPVTTDEVMIDVSQDVEDDPEHYTLPVEVVLEEGGDHEEVVLQHEGQELVEDHQNAEPNVGVNPVMLVTNHY